MLKRILPIIMAIAIVLAVFYMLGPKASVQNLAGKYPEIPTTPVDLENYVFQKEDTVKGLKPGNEAKIIWADPLNKEKTPYSIVYIHGFGASEMEGNPVNRKLAEYFGANLFLARLPEHGIDRVDAMKHLNAPKLMNGAREAYMIGKSLGDSVIVVGTSMGGALSINLASERSDMKALVLYSPAVGVNGDMLEQFFQPWRKFIFENFMLENGTRTMKREGEKAKYWSEQYHVNSYESLAVLIKSTMNDSTFQKITQPLFLGYFYKNEKEQDFVVSVPKMLDMYEKVSTPADQKYKNPFPESGDHVIASDITSKDWKGVLKSTIEFLEKLPLLNKTDSLSDNEILP
ncbi:esterase/lipase [Belliella baltica DSM 15883]|uniref:Esterase/lipase n=1 Tax=Belliella baltica (strain DSM 15883 / CIP 108006 / LMG 21964 / BA134) TaxID=866536 RepID=I3Z7E5_BELBD|nr:alpha/beta fold hydrolase [Belliella baltica]AFL85163.1 esterase/lipase [Belliella baltica DSM 15883]